MSSASVSISCTNAFPAFLSYAINIQDRLASLILGSHCRAQTEQLTSLHRCQSVGSMPCSIRSFNTQVSFFTLDPTYMYKVRKPGIVANRLFLTPRGEGEFAAPEQL